MGLVLMIAIPLILFSLSLIIPAVAKIIIHIDYLFIVILIWAFIFGASGQNEKALLYNTELHTSVIVLIYIGILSIWFGLQQIRIMRFYIFKIATCALASYIIITFASTGWFGETIANGMTMIWQITIGIFYFLVTILIRSKNNDLMKSA